MVDDEPDFLELMGFNLKRRGYQVSVARDGRTAIAHARQFVPDLILLDLMMPEMDGLSVCEVLRAHPLTGSIPVLIHTALSGQIARAHSLEAGATDFLTKSLTIRDLMSRIEQCLRRVPGSFKTPITHRAIPGRGNAPPHHFS